METVRCQKLMSLARVGWWEADFRKRIYICSDFLVDLLGLKSDTVSFEEFRLLIREDFRDRISNEFASILVQEVYEQVFPIYTRYGVTWVRSKLGEKNTDINDNLRAFGFIQCIEDRDEILSYESSLQRVNSLLYQQNSISCSLVSFLKEENITNVIHKILGDILRLFRKGRAYIFKYDWERQVQSCIYEVVDADVMPEIDKLQNLPLDSTPWWTKQMESKKPIIISSLDNLPECASQEKYYLKKQSIKSIMVVPMLDTDRVWGYMGIDIVDTFRHWSNEDYQWFASLANIISLCIEMRLSEEEVEKERLYLENLYKHMPLGYIRLRVISDERNSPIDYCVLDVNHAAEELSGILLSEYKNRTISEIGSCKIGQLKEKLKSADLSKNKELSMTFPLTQKTCFTVFYVPQPGEIVVLFGDTTKEIKAHEALDRSEKILRNIYMNIPVGIELYDKNGVLLDMNIRDVEIFGLNCKEDALGINLFENPNLPENVIESIRRKEPVSFRLNYPFKAVKGYYPTMKSGYIDLYTKVSMLYDSRGNLINYLFINIDNTEINNAYSKIAEFENSFSLVSRFGKVGYCKFDVVTREGYGVPQWYRNLGEDENTPLSRIIGVYEHVHEEDRQALFDFITQVKQGDIESFSKDLRICSSEGKYKWTRVNVIRNPMDENPDSLEMICVNYDITELKNAEDELINAKEKAEQSDMLKSAFLANMSHEIRTPLNAIVGFSELLFDTEEQEEKQEYISIVRDNNELLLQLISDILDLSKIESGTLEFVMGRIDVNLLCEDLVRSLRMKVSEKVELLFEDYQSEMYIIGDRNRIYQVISNFVNNAIKFTTKGRISVGYYLESDYLKFYVRDTGVGIAPDKVAHIFDRFIKLDNFVHGTGLGLSICKSLVEQMGGQIGVESEQGKGSCFWFTYPLKNLNQLEAHSNNLNTMEKVSEVVEKKPVILVAEDTDSNFLLVSTILKRDYEIIRAHDGVEAIEFTEKYIPCGILMDIRMPRIDGIEATYKIREMGYDMPIIAVTAFAFDRDRQKMLDAGCNDYITKPLSSAILKSTIKKWLEKEIMF